MFNKVATFRALTARRIAPGPIGAAHSNDNLPGFRRPAGGQRLRPKLALACHWYLIDGRLECRWDIEAPDGTPIADVEPQPKADRAFGPPARPRRDHLLLAVS
jgi:hypothetical protein